MPVDHMVWIKFHDGISDEQINTHLTNLGGMKPHVPAILEVKVGQNFTDRSGGYTHGLIVTVADKDALPEYINHPYHVEVATPLKADASLLAMDMEY